MVLIGILLIAVGVILAVFVDRVVGAVCAIVGLVVLLVVLIGGGEHVDGTAAVLGGMAVPTRATLAARREAAPTASREPVLVAFVLGAVPLVLAAATALADVFTGVPDWVVPALTVLGTLTTALAALWARLRVTPIGLARLDDGTPLVPSGPIPDAFRARVEGRITPEEYLADLDRRTRGPAA